MLVCLLGVGYSELHLSVDTDPSTRAFLLQLGSKYALTTGESALLSEPHNNVSLCNGQSWADRPVGSFFRSHITMSVYVMLSLGPTGQSAGWRGTETLTFDLFRHHKSDKCEI